MCWSEIQDSLASLGIGFENDKEVDNMKFSQYLKVNKILLITAFVFLMVSVALSVISAIVDIGHAGYFFLAAGMTFWHW